MIKTSVLHELYSIVYACIRIATISYDISIHHKLYYSDVKDFPEACVYDKSSR